MKQVLIYSNIAKNGKVVYDPLTGEVKMYKAKETTDNEDKVVVDRIKKFIANNPDENVTFIINRNLAAPMFQAMKVINTVLLGKITEDNEDAVAEYLENLAAAGINPETINTKDKDAVLKMVKVAINNTWTDEESLDFALDLALSTENKFMSIESIIAEPKEGVVLSPVSKNVRELALELVNKTCAIPELKKIAVLEEDDDPVEPAKDAQ